MHSYNLHIFQHQKPVKKMGQSEEFNLGRPGQFLYFDKEIQKSKTTIFVRVYQQLIVSFVAFFTELKLIHSFFGRSPLIKPCNLIVVCSFSLQCIY